MYVCTKPVYYDDGYSEVRCVPDTTLVSDDSDVLRHYPSHFKQLDPELVPGSRERLLAMQMGPARIRATAPVRPAPSAYGKESWRLPERSATCHASRRGSLTPVRIDQLADADLLDIYCNTTGADSDEAGGLLFGRLHIALGEVLRATGPGPNALRRRASFSHDPEHNRRVVMEMADLGLQLVGEWHSHPGGFRSLSTSDLTAHSGRRRLAGLPRYIALLVTPGAGDRIQYDAWVLRPDDHLGVDVAEEATIQ